MLFADLAQLSLSSCLLLTIWDGVFGQFNRVLQKFLTKFAFVQILDLKYKEITTKSPPTQLSSPLNKSCAHKVFEWKGSLVTSAPDQTKGI